MLSNTRYLGIVLRATMILSQRRTLETRPMSPAPNSLTLNTLHVYFNRRIKGFNAPTINSRNKSFKRFCINAIDIIPVTEEVLTYCCTSFLQTWLSWDPKVNQRRALASPGENKPKQSLKRSKYVRFHTSSSWCLWMLFKPTKIFAVNEN